MFLLIWTVACVVVVCLFRGKPSTLAVISLLLYIGVPSVARSLLVGSGVSLHPSAIFVTIALAGIGLTRLKGVFDAILSHWSRVLLLIALAVHASLLTVLGTGSTGQLVNSLLGPIFLLVIALVAIREEGRAAGLLMLKSLVLIAVAEACLGLIQVSVGRPLIYESQYARFYWFNPERFHRALGTLDSALDLAMLLVITVPLTKLVQHRLLRTAIVIILLGGVLATQSRLGTLLATVGAVYVALSDGSAKVRLAMVMGLLGSSVALLASPFGQGFITRVQNAQGSTARRSEALAYITENIFDRTLIGEGFNSSYALRSGSTLGSSLENGFAMYAFDFGWLPAAALLVFFLSIMVVDALRKNWVHVIGMFAAITMVAGFSSIMTQSASGMLLMFIAGAFLALQNLKSCTELTGEGERADPTLKGNCMPPTMRPGARLQ